MSSSKKDSPAERMAQQGHVVDAEQNMRLQFAGDPVYGHLATLATASAVCGIEWASRSGRKSDKLRAVLNQDGHRSKRFPRSAWEYYTAAVQTDSGVDVRGQLNFGLHTMLHRTLPVTLDEQLINVRSLPRLRKFLSSAVSLERPSTVYGTPTLKVGITATHNALIESNIGFSISNETTDPSAFRDVLGILEEVGEVPVGGYTEAGWVQTATRPATQMTTDPTKHFAFHEGLGVPSEVMERAKQSFGVLVTHMGLPYSLPQE